YQCQLQGIPLSQTPLSTQYDSFVEWQQKLFKSSHYPSIEQKWKERLEASEYPVLKISPFTPITANECSREKTVTIHPQIARKIKDFASQQKVTSPIVLMAAFHAILHLYTGEKELYVGFPSANRPRADFQKMIGFFVNTLVCKTKLRGSDTFLTLIQQVKEYLWTDAQETAYPFQHLLQRLHPPRVVNSSPLFQTMFVMQNAPTSRSHFHDCNIEFLPIKNSFPLYDLVLEVQQKQEGLHLVFEYKSEKIPGSFGEELGRAFGQFLEQALEEPAAPLEAHNLVTYEPRVIDLFEQQARENPNKIAIFSDQDNFTYGQLHQVVLKIASALVESGIKPSEPVGLCVEREPLLIASIFAILKAGGAYVPIDPTYPTARCEAITKDANLRFIVASKKGSETLSFFQGIIFNPKIESQRTNISTYFPRPKDQLAYILYTSGSTGAPKGVMVGCKNLLNFSQAAIDFFQITPADNVLQFSSICWDTSSEEIYPPLLTGGSLVLRGEGRVESFDTLLERTEKYQVSFWDLPSSYWHDLVDLLERKKIALPSSLRLVVVGGERVNRSKVQLWCEKIAPSIQLLNTYGATEATSISAVFDLSKWLPEWEDIPIGLAIQNVQLYILNSCLTPVPPGMPGDLYIGGAGVARGYLNLEQLTAERFIRHPKTQEMLYRTGDIALLTLTGEILLRGRRDRQIKRRGFRIEVEEIERTLASFAGVETALVLLKGALIGYVVPAKDALVSASTLKEFLKKQLPEYMVPDQLYLLSEIPRLHNGKIDQLSLDTYRIQGQEQIVKEVWSLTEEKILSIWKEVLSLELIGKEENFFDVGGHSLLLIKLHEKLQEAFSIQLDISTLFAHYTIASQAQKIENKSTNKSKLELLKQLASGSIDSAEAYLQLKNFQ
ncbi:MAG TPA: amino acid adenylation domain-containing protein, partial [Chlamydiales bacterium]|nr:amino acid adenylation domain-containing protein [Chlamydiales bacterium]